MAAKSKITKSKDDKKSPEKQLPSPKASEGSDLVEEPVENTATTEKSDSGVNDDKKNGKKRKNEAASDQAPKVARRSARGPSKSKPTQQQMLSFLLSKEAEDLCRPQDEKDDLEKRGKDIKTYTTSVLTPFEELVCAVVLSRPISHRLGLRTIRTIFNDPYNFTTPKAIRDAGEEKQQKALWDAKTQHKGKTADQIGGIANVILEKFTSDGDEGGTQLKKVLQDSDNDIDDALSLLKDSIKGLGTTGLDIFLRRVQWLWSDAFPYVDGKTRLSLKELGLPDDADDLRKAIESQWKKLDTAHLAGDDEKAKQRRAFVVVLERAVGADLEGQLQTALKSAAAA